MAQKVQIKLLSDLALAGDPDSEVLADRTVRFYVDGEGFEIDLSNAEFAALDEMIDPYRKAGRPVGRGGKPKGQGRGARSSKPVNTVKVREWARENGIEIKGRGRVPADVMAKYKAADAD